MSWFEEGVEEAGLFWADVFNPMGYVDLATDPTWEKAETQGLHMATKMAMFTAAASIPWALSGGGASMGMWFGASPPTPQRMFFLKADTYRQMVEATRHAAPHVARATPYVVGGAVVAGTVHAIETGDYSYTVAGQVVDPVVSSWLSGIGKNDPRGGRESGLFYNP